MTGTTGMEQHESKKNTSLITLTVYTVDGLISGGLITGGFNVGFYGIYHLWLSESSTYFALCVILKLALSM